MTMEISEIVFIALGLMLSVVAFFLKKESVKVDNLSQKIRKIEIDLAENNARDGERWRETQKLLEDRRQDSIKVFEKIEKINHTIDKK
jgi:predicted Holliday junction resolvase-like endonuclease